MLSKNDQDAISGAHAGRKIEIQKIPVPGRVFGSPLTMKQMPLSPPSTRLRKDVSNEEIDAVILAEMRRGI